MNLIESFDPIVLPRPARAPASAWQKRVKSLAASRRIRIWSVLVGAIALALLVPAVVPGNTWLAQIGFTYAPWSAIAIFFTAMLAEYFDSSLGMGYGTTLTPVLLLCGFPLTDIVPAVLLSECLTGLAAGALHHRDGNVDFLGDRQARRILLWILSFSALGGTLAAFTAVRISEFWLRLIVAAIIIGVGAVILLTARKRISFRPAQLIAVGAVAAFNKALSGGGYGPLVTGGQVVSGISARQAVAITSAGEGLTCLVGLTAYFLMGRGVSWSLAIPLVAGGLLSVPLATLTVRKMSETALRYVVGVAACLLGAALLAKMST